MLSYLIKVYGDAEDDEHIKLARVLQKVLHFSPGEAAAVNSKIDYYLQSWWHRAAAAAGGRGSPPPCPPADRRPSGQHPFGTQAASAAPAQHAYSTAMPTARRLLGTCSLTPPLGTACRATR